MYYISRYASFIDDYRSSNGLASELADHFPRRHNKKRPMYFYTDLLIVFGSL